MKGQYRVVSELILLAIGIMITSYIIINFNIVEESVKEVTVKDQLESVADVVAVAISKVANTENSTIALRIPSTVSESVYDISLSNEGGGRLIVSTETARVERQLFNINKDSSNVIDNSAVTSSAEFIEVVKKGTITIRRVPIG